MCNSCTGTKQKEVSRNTVEKILQAHGWTFDKQTSVLDGQFVESGSSFDEAFGVKENYNLHNVYLWLGY